MAITRARGRHPVGRARAEMFDHIEGFLNEHVYDYKVKLGEVKILPDKAK